MRMNTFGRYFFVIALSAVTNMGCAQLWSSRFGDDGSSTNQMLNSFDSSLMLIFFPIECVADVCSYPIAKNAAKEHNSRVRDKSDVITVVQHRSTEISVSNLIFAPLGATVMPAIGVCALPFGCYYYAKGVVTGEHSWNLSDVHPSQPFFQLYPEDFHSSRRDEYLKTAKSVKPPVATDYSSRELMDKSFEDAAKFIPAPYVCLSQLTVGQYTEILKGNRDADSYRTYGARNLPISPIMTVYGMARGVQGSYYFTKGVVTGEFLGNQQRNELPAQPRKNGKGK